MKTLRTHAPLLALATLASLGLAAAPAAHAQQTQTFYVSNFQHIDQISSSGGTQSPFQTTGSQRTYEGLAFDSAGNLYAAISLAGFDSIRKYSNTNGILSPSNATLFASNAGGQVNAPLALTFDSAGNLYVANSGSGGSIYKFSNSTGTLSTTGTSFASGLGTSFGLASSGNTVYASIFGGGTSTTSNTIQAFDTATGTASTFASTGLMGPTGLVFDSTGNLYAANNGNNTIEKFANTNGTLNNIGTQFNTTFTSGALSNPIGLTFDSTGNLYAANNSGGTIERFDAAGVGTQFATDTNGANYIAFGTAAAPEPSEWALLGFAGIGIPALLLRARKRQAA